MASVWYRCRKCRAYLFSNEHLISEITGKCEDEASGANTDHQQKDKPSEVVTDEDEEISHTSGCSLETLYFIKLEGCPVWIKRLAERGQFLKGKLNCPQCSGRVGLYDFLSKTLCECGKHVMHPIHIVKSRIDESRSRLNVRISNIPKAQRPEFQVIKTMEEAGLLNHYKPCEQIAHLDTDDLGPSPSAESEPTPGNSNTSPKKFHKKCSNKRFSESGPEVETTTSKSKGISARNNDWNKKETPNPFAPLEVPESPSNDDAVPKPDVNVDEYTCPICLDVFYHPYTIKPCKHVFCGPCLRRLAGTKPQSTKCPLCRKAISLCLPNYDMTQMVRKKYPQDWLMRHKMELKVRGKLPDLPSSTISRRRVKKTASTLLSQSAGVVFVAFFVMFFITVLMIVTSCILWKMFEQFGEEFVQLVSGFQKVVDGSWNLFLIFLFEKRISQDTCQTVLEALTDLSHSVAKMYNSTRIH